MKTKDKVKMSRSPDGKKPLTWLATLATLSPGRGLVTTFIGEPEQCAKYKNRGNEAKKYLKKKDLTFFSAANVARFARKSKPLRPQTATSCENELRSCDLRTFRPPPRQLSGFRLPNWLMRPGFRRRQNAIGGQTCKAHWQVSRANWRSLWKRFSPTLWRYTPVVTFHQAEFTGGPVSS
jgi:hypothetical protein